MGRKKKPKTVQQYYHTSPFQLYIKTSQIPNAGCGVYTKELIPEGTVIDEYYGELYRIHHSPSRYYLEVDEGVGIDAFNFPRCYMAMINDTHGTLYTINCEFICDKQAQRAYVKTLFDIQPETELFVSYGDCYWSA